MSQRVTIHGNAFVTSSSFADIEWRCRLTACYGGCHFKFAFWRWDREQSKNHGIGWSVTNSFKYCICALSSWDKKPYNKMPNLDVFLPCIQLAVLPGRTRVDKYKIWGINQQNMSWEYKTVEMLQVTVSHGRSISSLKPAMCHFGACCSMHWDIALGNIIVVHMLNDNSKQNYF